MTTAIPIAISEPAGIARVRQPVTVGLPLPRALVRDLSHLSLHDPSGHAAPLQAAALNRWSDGSVKWALLDFQVDVAAGATTECVLRVGTGRRDGPSTAGLKIVEGPEGFGVTTGTASFTVERHHFDPACRALLDGAPVTDRSATGWLLEDAVGRIHTAIVRAVAIETRGPVRTTFRIDGAFGLAANPIAEFTARLSFFSGSATIRLVLTVRNPRRARHRANQWDLGDPASIHLRDLSVQVALSDSEQPLTSWSTEPGGLAGAGDHDLEIYQDSSGGPNWASRNHVNRRDEVTTAFCGYRVRAAGKEARGLRAEPLVALRAGTAGAAAAISAFWQNFPKAIEVSGNRLVLRLFPRQSLDVHELQGGEQKTHVVHLAFFRGAADLAALAEARGELVARAPADWYASSGAVPYLTPRAADRRAAYLALVDLAIDGHSAFARKREIVDEYGWRHFGDVYADHEAVHYHGPPPVISHYNNQYDVIYGAGVHFLRSGDARWRAMMRELAAHVVDIDIYHAADDRPEYAGGHFWHTDHYQSALTATHRTYSRRAGRHGGGPSSGHCYTSGLTLHYFLTGEEASREAVIGLAEWILAMEDGARSRLRWLDRGPTGCASATHTPSYHGPGRAPANAVNTLLDAALLTADRRYADAADCLIRRCIHPRDDIAARRLDEAETRWSYTMFLQVLGRYLDVKVERGELDRMYAYGRESLVAYARWMARREAPYLSRADRLEFPTETWSAQDMRKSDVFKFAAKHAAGAERERFLERSEFFFRSSVTELTEAKTRDLTRPVAIMMTCGYMHAYFDRHPGEAAPAAPTGLDFGVPSPFATQRDRVISKLKAAGAAGLAAALAAGYHFGTGP